MSEGVRERERAGGTKEATVHVPSMKYSLASVQLRGNPLEYSRCLRQRSDTGKDEDKLKLHGNDADMSITHCLEWE